MCALSNISLSPSLFSHHIFLPGLYIPSLIAHKKSRAAQQPGQNQRICKDFATSPAKASPYQNRTSS